MNKGTPILKAVEKQYVITVAGVPCWIGYVSWRGLVKAFFVMLGAFIVETLISLGIALPKNLFKVFRSFETPMITVLLSATRMSFPDDNLKRMTIKRYLPIKWNGNFVNEKPIFDKS